MPIKTKVSISKPATKTKTVSGVDMVKLTVALNKLPAWVDYTVQPSAQPKLDKSKKVVEVTLKATCTAIRPKWAEYAKTTSARKAEWDRMIASADTYVKNHHDMFTKAVDAFAKTLKDQDLDKSAFDKLWRVTKAELLKGVEEYKSKTSNGKNLGIELALVGPDPAKPTADIKKPKVSNDIKVRGATIAEVLDNLNKKGYWGRYRSHESYKADFALDGTLSEIKLKAQPKITMPKWTQYSSGNSDQKATWDSMYAALLKHENNHHSYFLEAAAQFLARIKDAGLDKNTMKSEWETFKTEMKDTQDTYDDRSDHGANEGVVLDANADP